MRVINKVDEAIQFRPSLLSSTHVILDLIMPGFPLWSFECNSNILANKTIIQNQLFLGVDIYITVPFTPKVNTQTHFVFLKCAAARNVWNTHAWSAHFRRSSYTELAPRRAEVWPCLIHTSYVSFTQSTKRTLMSRRPGKNTKLKSLAIYSIMSIFYGLLHTDRYHIFLIFYLT